MLIGIVVLAVVLAIVERAIRRKFWVRLYQFRLSIAYRFGKKYYSVDSKGNLYTYVKARDSRREIGILEKHTYKDSNKTVYCFCHTTVYPTKHEAYAHMLKHVRESAEFWNKTWTEQLEENRELKTRLGLDPYKPL